MKKHIDGEKISIVIGILIVVVVILLVIFAIYRSNFSFYSNERKKSEVPSKIPIEENNSSSNSSTNSSSVTPPEPPKKEVEKEIANFTSSIYDKESGRIHNITLAISKLNGKIIKKGEEFSFNNTIGQMGKEQGYQKALGFDGDGNKIQIYGGGMCQISSTLYNSILISNLEVTERHPHSRRVYYVPKDKDATIYYGSLDLKFKNNTTNDIKIIASNTDSSVTIQIVKLVLE